MLLFVKRPHEMVESIFIFCVDISVDNNKTKYIFLLICIMKTFFYLKYIFFIFCVDISLDTYNTDQKKFSFVKKYLNLTLKLFTILLPWKDKVLSAF